ncbi:MAG: carboxypeptidase regulatory-like domain-containing protein, partial [Terriglobia bacterium]
MAATWARRFGSYVLAVVIVLGVVGPPATLGQVVGATITGTVTDTSGAVTPSVRIVVTNMATGFTTSVITNGVGFYTVPNLTPGHYRLTSSGRGFKTEVRTGIILTVGQDLVLNLTMQLGTVTETVQVTGAAPTVDLANSTLGGLNNATTVEQLPLNGRSWTDLAALQPGVHFVQDQPSIVTESNRVNRGLGLELTISGARPQQNNYLLDGVNINDFTNGGPGSLLAGNLGADAVAEFSVLTTNYSTQYGRSSGGVISAITKSGTNQFHGDTYEFIRNDALDARNFFDGAVIPPFRRNQFGGSAGGP